MTVETQPVMPAETGNVSVDTAARHAHFHNLTAFFERNPQAGQDVRAKYSLSGASGPHEAVPTTAVPAANPTERVREFDAEMREKGLQRSGEPDQKALDFLISIKRKTPEALQTSDWKQSWEKQYAQVFGAENPQAAPVEQTLEPVPPAELNAAVESLSKASNAEGRAHHGAFPPALLSGYTLPPGSYDSVQTVTELKAARAAGLTQTQINQIIATRMKGNG